MAIVGASAISERMKAATDQPRLPLSTSRWSRRRKGGRAILSRPLLLSSSAPRSGTIPAALAFVEHQRRNRLLREKLIGLFERVGEGVGGRDHRLDQVGAGEGKRAGPHGGAAMVLGGGDQ